jgi:DMSO/TMAO reductase YedYZ molybdopterin-dependent catalytic subunit
MTYVILFVGGLTFQKTKQIVLGLLTVFILIATSVGIMVWWTTRDPTDLGYEEIREYEGQDLSSIGAFRENSIKGPQHIDNQTYKLTVTGLVNAEKEYTYTQIIDGYTTYKKVVTLHCVEGWKATILWEGILLKDLLADSVVDSNANTVIFHAYDGYTTSLPLDYITDNNIMIAYRMNNVTLPPERGFPFQLVAESKWGYKWIKWITTIELSDNPDYRGFWESRGYSNNADL